MKVIESLPIHSENPYTLRIILPEGPPRPSPNSWEPRTFEPLERTASSYLLRFNVHISVEGKAARASLRKLAGTAMRPNGPDQANVEITGKVTDAAPIRMALRLFQWVSFHPDCHARFTHHQETLNVGIILASNREILLKMTPDELSSLVRNTLKDESLSLVRKSLKD